MAYKINTVVISIPLSISDNEKLKEIAAEKRISKKKLASKYIQEAINREYEKAESE